MLEVEFPHQPKGLRNGAKAATFPSLEAGCVAAPDCIRGLMSDLNQ